MICETCQNELGNCVCPDLRAKIESLKEIPFLLISPQQMARYEAQIKRNESQQTVSE